MQEGKPIEITDETFQQEVIESHKPVLVDFWATWCGPCKMIAPVLKKIATECKDDIKICKLNIENGQQVATQYGIMSVPTLIFFNQGQPVNTINGITPNFESDLKEKISNL